MWMLSGILALTAICFVIEIPSLRAHRKDLWTFILLMGFGTSLSIAMALKAHISNPLDWIAAVFEPLGSGMKHFFQ
jgi:hypothetical protein